MKRKPYCGEYILELLEKKGGQSTREELRIDLVANGYGSEAIRQAYLTLLRRELISTKGSSHSQKQIIILEEGKKKDV